MEFKRDELTKLELRAIKASKIPSLNSSWKRAYLKLADSANHLDAMIARCTVENIGIG